MRVEAFRLERRHAPLDAERGVIYARHGSPFVSHRCPCGCSADVMLATLHDEGVVIDGDEVTLPAFEASDGCPGYQIVRNRVVWAEG